MKKLVKLIEKAKLEKVDSVRFPRLSGVPSCAGWDGT